MRIRTVEYEPGWGWIARDPRTGKEVIHDFRWSSRAIARQVVSGMRPLCAAPQPVARVPLDEARRLFDAGWKACANFCDREDVRFDGIVGHRGCLQFEAAFSAAQGIKGGQHGDAKP